MDIIAEKQIDIANVKLIATDMDGTLLNGEKELPPDFYQVFQQIHAQGILFAAASGRQFFNLQQEFEPI
ncbi:MAG TPA: HAD hydrolase family protein, partial [Flavihumibacter sp.]|nr:HAD hydrolase family protein [Flavihumibacter sp.]